MSEDSRKRERGPSSRLRFESEEQAAGTSGQLGPKSKPGAKGRRRLAEAPADPKAPPPILDAPDASPPVEDTPATSGQVGPKLKPGGKFRTDSEKARPSDRLRYDGEPPPDGEAVAPEDGGPAPPGGEAGAAPHDNPGPKDKKAAREDRRFEKSGRRVEKSGDKLDNARDKLAKQKLLKRPGPVKMVGHAASHQAWKYVHGKIHEVERENVGVEAAHKTELAGEKVIRRTTRFIKRRIRTRPARRVRKWEKKNIKARADHTFRQLAQEHPELNKNALSRFYQKQRIKKRYQKQAREAAKATKKSAVTVKKIAGAVVRLCVEC